MNSCQTEKCYLQYVQGEELATLTIVEGVNMSVNSAAKAAETLEGIAHWMSDEGVDFESERYMAIVATEACEDWANDLWNNGADDRDCPEPEEHSSKTKPQEHPARHQHKE